jgi:hypothetical protein
MADRADPDGPEVRHRVLNADGVEAELLSQFTAHPLFAAVEGLEGAAFLEVLLQRRFLSLLFPVVYDVGIDGLDGEAAGRLVREILREEYPDATGATPSHREDLVADLLVLGASRGQILAARPTAATTAVVEQTLGLALGAAAAPGDAAVLTVLRFWGEVLVSVEYGEFWRPMAAVFEDAGAASRFYHPHHHHDGREPLAAASDSSATHSGRLGACLARLLAQDADAGAQFARVERAVLATRMRFYDQFV